MQNGAPPGLQRLLLSLRPCRKELNVLALENPRVFYDMLFTASSRIHRSGHRSGLT
jgi:hypothetical protein